MLMSYFLFVSRLQKLISDFVSSQFVSSNAISLVRFDVFSDFEYRKFQLLFTCAQMLVKDASQMLPLVKVLEYPWIVQNAHFSGIIGQVLEHPWKVKFDQFRNS
jgi:hypothetical protein